MSNHLLWNDRFNIGVELIDKEHKKLFRLINKLFGLGGEEKTSRWACQEAVKYFKDHALRHFADEEAYMKSIQYEEFEMHRRIHDDFQKKTLPALAKELERTDYAPEAVDHFLGVCTGWLVGHTLLEDQAIVGKERSLWKSLMPREAHDVMEKAIIDELYSLFRVESRQISESYGGEKFGNGIYYRIVHEAKTGERCETLLVFEEKVLINTIGQMIDDKLKKLTPTVMNAVRYTAQQFVNGIMEHYPDGDRFVMKAENLLTYEQFQKIYEKEHPQFSMLFDTGVGYFAYCAIAPHVERESIKDTITADNAVEEIKKYLERTKEEHEAEAKKKILVVDDSATMLHAMKQILDADYEITLAKSGIAAIRCITLDIPDLVMLDYEMPVCDGKQVLGMIRSEEEFKHIPVIFLTGRRDMESVKQVMSLKPDAYLLKDQKLEEIKKCIDEFFLKKASK